MVNSADLSNVIGICNVSLGMFVSLIGTVTVFFLIKVKASYIVAFTISIRTP